MIAGKNYCINAENLFGHELIGLNVEILNSTDISRKIFGKIVDETKNVFIIESGNAEKIVPKSECVFGFDLENEKVEVDGKFLAEKPENRVKTFFKKFANRKNAVKVYG